MRQAFLQIKRNWKPLAGFEVAYHMFTFFLLTPLFYALFQLSIRLSGFTYLSTESISAYVRHPAAIVLILLFIFVVPLVAIFNMTAVIECFYASRRNERITVAQMLHAGARGFCRIWTRKNVLLLPLVALLVPLSCLPTDVGYRTLHQIPSFILDFIWNAPLLSAIYLCLLFVLFYMAVRLCFCIHVYAVENGSVMDAVKTSLRLTHRRFWRTAWCILLWQGTLLAAMLALCGMVGIPVVLLIRLFAPAQTGFYAALFFLWLLNNSFFRIFAWFAVALSFARFGTLYSEYKAVPDVPRSVAPPATLPRSIKRALVVAFVVGLSASAASYLHAQYTEFRLMHQFLQVPAVSAHRGDSFSAPENSIPAFQSAIDIGADWIELDVHQTKDGVVVVSHDADLKRIAGVKKNIWEMTYEEIQQYDVGSWFSPAFSGLRLATLDEVLKLCKGKIKLNIELKPTGHEENFEQNVIDLVLQNGFENDCVLASLNADCLRRVEELNPAMKTVYNMAVATGGFVDIPYIDGYSIEFSFIDKNVVRTVKKHNKFIFVWTVNDPARIEAAIALQVDNIITDDPVLAKSVIYDGQVNDLISDMVALLFSVEDTGYRTSPPPPTTASEAIAEM